VAIRNIVKIDQAKCNGCGLCVQACAEGAIAIVEGKARLVSETYCDGLGACLGDCPQGAITIERRQADDFDEQAAHKHVGGLKAAAPVQALGQSGAGSLHLQPQPAHAMPHPGGCPGGMARQFKPASATAQTAVAAEAAGQAAGPVPSELGQWPVQLALVNPRAAYFKDAHLLIAADCVAYALGDFHRQLLKGRVLAIACPKLDDVEPYVAKLAEIFRVNQVRSVTVAHMEVPCCGGIVQAVRAALAQAGREDLPFQDVTVGVDGSIRHDG
jgi:Pyruvate/2-oxoacid:ferredoxin oxidoreductase delta subunit